VLTRTSDSQTRTPGTQKIPAEKAVMTVQ